MKQYLVVALLAGAALSAPAHALTINLNDLGGVTGSPAEQGFRIAANYWESVFSNAAVVNFNVGYAHLGPGVLGNATIVPTVTVSMDFYQDKLRTTGTTALDTAAKSHLAPLTSGGVSAIVPDYLETNKDVAGSGTRFSPAGQPISGTKKIFSSAGVSQ